MGKDKRTKGARVKFEIDPRGNGSCSTYFVIPGPDEMTLDEAFQEACGHIMCAMRPAWLGFGGPMGSWAATRSDFARAHHLAGAVFRDKSEGTGVSLHIDVPGEPGSELSAALDTDAPKEELLRQIDGVIEKMKEGLIRKLIPDADGGDAEGIGTAQPGPGASSVISLDGDAPAPEGGKEAGSAEDGGNGEGSKGNKDRFWLGIAQGREEAWGLARRIACEGDGCFTAKELKKAFGAKEEDIFSLTAKEAFEKADAFDLAEMEAIHAGDVAEFWQGGRRRAGLVVKIREGNGDARIADIMLQDGSLARARMEELVKTGRRVDIERIRETIRGGGNDEFLFL